MTAHISLNTLLLQMGKLRPGEWQACAHSILLCSIPQPTGSRHLGRWVQWPFRGTHSQGPWGEGLQVYGDDQAPGHTAASALLEDQAYTKLQGKTGLGQNTPGTGPISPFP